MDAHKRMLILDILAKENRQFVVPIYQREYKWTSEQCNRLIDDILSCSKSNKEHFLGSIVYQLDKDPDLSNLKLYLVDGQQRVTTMLLLTKALNLIASENQNKHRSMIDFQNGGLEHQVYELISKICDLACSDEFPHFVTTEQEKGIWECKLSIPGVKTTAVAHGKTEVESINRCAINMIFILKKDHDKDQLDPDLEDSIFAGNIEQFFGDIVYDPKYKYHLFESDILIKPDDVEIINFIKNQMKDSVRKLHECVEEIDEMSQIVTLRFLVKKKKDNYC